VTGAITGAGSPILKVGSAARKEAKVISPIEKVATAKIRANIFVLT
jgi:hypothetical protein